MSLGAGSSGSGSPLLQHTVTLSKLCTHNLGRCDPCQDPHFSFPLYNGFVEGELRAFRSFCAKLL